MHCRISLRRAYNPCGYTMKMNFKYHGLLIYDVNLTTKIDGMGPFNSPRCFYGFNTHTIDFIVIKADN